MANVLVDCILKPSPGDTEAGITHVGGPGGGRWLLSRQAILNRLTWRVDTFFIRTGDERAELAVRGENSQQCVQARSDRHGENRLLRLPDCPAADLWSWVQAVSPPPRRNRALSRH
jgi:hypothetical protein